MSRTFRGPEGRRDGKAWQKPTSDFKKLKRAERRAKSKQALREMTDPESFVDTQFRKTDVWDWN